MRKKKRKQPGHRRTTCAVAVVGVTFAYVTIQCALHNAAPKLRSYRDRNEAPSPLQRNNIQTAPEQLIVYDLRPGKKEPSFLQEVDMAQLLMPRDQELPIDRVHRLGLWHTGTSQFVVDMNSNLLLLKRGPQLVTCPNAWLMMGEHTHGHESPLDTARRGVLEELGPSALKHSRSFTTLTDQPLYYYRQHDNRLDRQALYLWWIQLDVQGKDLTLEFDTEVADYMWISLSDLEKWVQKEYQSLKSGGETEMCHESILQLFGVAIAALRNKLG